MCGRFSFSFLPQDFLKYLDLAGIVFSPRFNIAPTQHILILRTDSEGRKELVPVRWGLIPACPTPSPKCL